MHGHVDARTVDLGAHLLQHLPRSRSRSRAALSITVCLREHGAIRCSRAPTLGKPARAVRRQVLREAHGTVLDLMVARATRPLLVMPRREPIARAGSATTHPSAPHELAQHHTDARSLPIEAASAVVSRRAW